MLEREICRRTGTDCPEMAQLRRELDRSRVQLWRFSLEKLAKESTAETRSTARAFLEGVGFPLLSPYYCVLLIKRCGEEVRRPAEKREVNCWEGLHVVIREFFEKRISAAFDQFFFPHDGMVAAYVPLPLPADAAADAVHEAEKKLFQLCAEATADFIRETGVEIRLVLSDAEAGIGNLYKVYARTRSLADGIFLGDFFKNAFFYTDALKGILGGAAVNRERSRLEKLFSSSILTRDFDVAVDAVCRIIDLDCRATCRCLYVKSQLEDRVSKTYVIYEILPAETGGALPDMETVRLRIQDAKSSRQLKDLVRELFGQIEAYLSDEEGEDKTARVIRFIYENYNDPDLSVQKIADVFGLSLSYLSRRFKEKTGERLIDFITSCRVEAAKQLLLDTRLSIPAVSEKVGYASDLTFSRAFYRLEGVTPGKFRRE